jgi:25S rRNA (adenine2142-N1)-methyltransferase
VECELFAVAIRKLPLSVACGIKSLYRIIIIMSGTSVHEHNPPQKKKSTKKKKKKKTVQPLTLLPHQLLPSRKRARHITTHFHALTRQCAVGQADASALESNRQAYQRASQVSTSYFSTSKWVLSYLHRNGWLYGIRCGSSSSAPTRRTTRLLEVGAINTQLLDAAEPISTKEGSSLEQAHITHSTKKNNVQVRAIDLHSMDARIEQADFLTLHLEPTVEERYDVVVCSMVINCVPTPEQRGRMLTKLYMAVRPGGLLFLTLPKTCLQHSPFLDRALFQELLVQVIGWDVQETKETPKIAFYVLQRPVTAPDNGQEQAHKLDPKWSTLRRVFHGKKYRNDFSVIITQHDFLDTALHQVAQDESTQK